MADVDPGRPVSGRSHQELDVLHVITTTTPRGAERFAVELAAALQQWGWRGRTVALTDGPGARLDGVPALGPSRLGRTTLSALRSEARRADVVVAHGSTTLPASFLATLGTGVPFVYRNIGDPAFWITSRARRLRSGFLLSRATRVTALTGGIATTLEQLYHLPASRIDVIPQATSTAAFPLRDAAAHRSAREHLGLADGDRLAVALGALSPEKDLVTAVRAVGLLPGRWSLAIAGDGPERPRIEAAAAELGGDRVRLLGRVDDPAPVLTAADVLLLPSRTEGLPGVVIEAAMVGVPAVVTEVGYVAEIVEDGVSGAIVPPGDPAAMAAAVEAIEPRLGAMGLAANALVAERFSFERVVEQWAASLALATGGGAG